jgi:hypothetical protein
MDRDHFDNFTRLISTAGTRRTALGALLGAALIGIGGIADTDAQRRRKRRMRRRRKNRGKANKDRVCYGTLTCPPPATGKDFDDCDYSSTNIFVDANAGGSSFRRTNFANAVMDGADLQGTIFRDSNLAGASMVGVDVRGASFPGACLLDTDLTGHIFVEGEVPFALSFLCNTRDGNAVVDRDCNNLPSCCRRSDEADGVAG